MGRGLWSLRALGRLEGKKDEGSKGRRSSSTSPSKNKQRFVRNQELAGREGITVSSSFELPTGLNLVRSSESLRLSAGLTC